MTLPLTEKQERVWRYIRSCGRSPTYEEMKRDLGYTSRGELKRTILRLKEKGFISYLPFRARSLVALNPQFELSHVATADLTAELARRAG